MDNLLVSNAHRIIRNQLTSIILMLLIQHCAFFMGKAQTGSQIKDVRVKWPLVSCRYIPRCADSIVTRLRPDQIELRDYADRSVNFTMTCGPSIPQRDHQRVALVLDRSGSMASRTPTQLSIMQRGVSQYFSMLDARYDSAALITFASKATIDVFLTSDTALLRKSLYAINPQGGTALFDGIALGIEELSKSASLPRYVIAITDGEDNSSLISIDSLIAMSRRSGVKVFIIGLGGGQIEDDARRLANETGGEFYVWPIGSEILLPMRQVYHAIAQRCFSCELSFMAECENGSDRPFRLFFSDSSSCFPSDTAGGSFTAIYDTSKLVRILESPQSAFLKLQSTVTFRVRALRATRFQWLKNFVPIAGATADTFSIPSIDFSDAGSYCVEVYSDCMSMIRLCTGLSIKVDVKHAVAAADFALLYANFPNPFTTITEISFALTHRTDVELCIYDLLGRKIETISKGIFDAGKQSVMYIPNRLPAGLYFVRMNAGGIVRTHPIMKSH